MTRAGWMAVEREFNRRERLKEVSLGFGRWGRWGRGSCEGYGLDIGHLLRFAVVASPDRTRWRARLNGAEIGTHDSFEAAIAQCEGGAAGDAVRTRTLGNIEAQPQARRRSGRGR